jgi:anti-sigma factor RsiW
MTAMTMPLNCDEFAAKLADYLDGDLPDAERVAMEAHASSCEACARLLSEIESLRLDAAALPLLEPSRDLWAGIAERIDARVLPLGTARTARVAALRRTWRHPAVAAAALVLITAGVTHVWTRLSYETPAAAPNATQRIAAASPLVVEGGSSPAATTTPTTSAAPSERPAQRRNTGSTSGAAPRAAGTRVVTQPSVTQVSRTLSPARVMTTEVEPMYDREIVKLRAIVRERRSQLDPRTVAVLEQSIAVIDSAIAQSRAALAKDPASGFLATQLNHSLEKKVELLRTTALLPART